MSDLSAGLHVLWIWRWPSPGWLGAHTGATLHAANGEHATAAGSISHVELHGPVSGGVEGQVECEDDAVLVAGKLIANSELLVEAGLDVTMPSRQPVTKTRLSYELSQPGWFVGALPHHA